MRIHYGVSRTIAQWRPAGHSVRRCRRGQTRERIRSGCAFGATPIRQIAAAGQQLAENPIRRVDKPRIGRRAKVRFLDEPEESRKNSTAILGLDMDSSPPRSNEAVGVAGTGRQQDGPTDQR
jgi:hypothetical protein